MARPVAPSAPLHPVQSVSHHGLQAGTRLIVTGAVHGNETCGTTAIRRVMAEIDAALADPGRQIHRQGLSEPLPEPPTTGSHRAAARWSAGPPARRLARALADCPP